MTPSTPMPATQPDKCQSFSKTVNFVRLGGTFRLKEKIGSVYFGSYQT